MPSLVTSNQQLSEEQVINGFHIFLQTALAQAKAERLLDADTLASAAADIMISGPALSLFFGALRSTTDPPSVPLPRSRSDPSSSPRYLSSTTSPPAFVPFVQVWASNVSAIQALPSEHQHDLARVICDLEPLSRPAHSDINRIAADLRAVAIEISQRRTFQERYQADLQAAIDAGQIGRGSRRAGHNVTASFVPPPMYEEKDPTSTGSYTPEPRTPEPSQVTVPAPTPQDTGMAIIRETLYASLADVISMTPTLRDTLVTDPPRAYFSSVALAVLNVSLTSLTPDGYVRGVLGEELTLEECPPSLQPLMKELGAIAKVALAYAQEDDEDAVRLVARGKPVPEPRMDRVRKILESGVGYDERERSSDTVEDGRRSVEGRAVQFANRINKLALIMTGLPTFQAYAKDVFQVLSAVG